MILKFQRFYRRLHTQSGHKPQSVAGVRQRAARSRNFCPPGYDLAMRLLFFAFLMCLLPLRGWTATTMAMSMATAQVASATHHAQATRDVAHAFGGQDTDAAALTTMPADCTMHAESRDTANTAAGESDDTGYTPCGVCDTCEACLAIASFTAASHNVVLFSPGLLPAAMPHSFISADHASRLKPPIS